MGQRICVGLCSDCTFTGYCRRTVPSKIVTDRELRNDAFRVDAHNSVFERVKRISHRGRGDFYTEHYLRFLGWFADKSGEEIFPDLDPLFDASAEWWRDHFNARRSDDNPTQLRTENYERLRGLFSLHRALFPQDALLWGLRPVNDNEVQ